MLRRLRALWRTLVRGRALDRDLSDELDTYVGLIVDDAVARGEDPAVARRRALAAMGGRVPVEEAVRAGRAGAWLVDGWRDVRYGLRILGRAPSFAVSAVLTLALAIGATAALASAVRTILLSPLPYPRADRLLQVVGHGYAGEYLEFGARARTFEPAAHAGLQPQTLTGRGEPVRLETIAATTDLLTVLGVRPLLGAGFNAADGRPGAEPVVLVSHRIWQERLGGRPDAIGQVLMLDGVGRRVRGVMPAAFAFPAATTDIWVPATIDPADRIGTWSRSGTIVGRLTDGHTLADAHAEVRALTPSFAALFPWRMPPGYGEDASVLSLVDATVGDVTTTLVAALAAVTFVLVIACLNVGILLAGRSIARQTEMATRAALGASRLRLARQALAEGAALAGLGGALGLLVAAAATAALVQLLPADAPRLHEVGAGGWLVVAVLALSAFSGTVIGVTPAIRAARRRLDAVLTVRVPGGDRRSRRAARALVAIEIALAVWLVVGAVLFGRSLDRLLEVDPGFEAANLTRATIALPQHRYESPAARRALVADLTARLETMADITAVAFTDQAPFAGEAWGSVFVIEGRPDPARVSGDWPWTDVRAIVSDGYFRTMRIPVTDGRTFDAGDQETSQAVAIVNDALARQYWPGESAVGRRIRFPGMAAGQWLTIVGTVETTKWQSLSESPRGALYLPIAQASPGTVTALVRASEGLGPDGLGPRLRAAVAGLDRDMPVDRIGSVDALVGASAGASRFLAVLFSGFAGVGALLGAIGIYGVTADAVARRRHEIAVRLAMGAGDAGVVGLLVRQSAGVAAAGVLAGVAGALAGGRFVAGLLYGVSPADPITFTIVPAVLLLVVVAASYLPARRATRVRPLDVLRAG